MRTLWDQAARDELCRRFETLTPERPASWGRMTCPQMLAHVSDGMRMALGSLPTEAKGGPLRYWPLKQLIIYVLPFPKGAPTAPELLARPPGAWDSEIESLGLLIGSFGGRDRDGVWPEHPAFGRLSGRDWAAVTYKHLDHHLRQFGA
jgi:hypothetical protein